jgi:hypothetical protein
MPKFKVTLTRVYESEAEVEVEAENEHEAKELAWERTDELHPNEWSSIRLEDGYSKAELIDV